MKRASSIVWRALIGLALISPLGCSMGFNNDWDAAASAPPADDITGRWVGTWTSQATGHTGELRALISKSPDNQYEARYHAMFGSIFSFEYSARFTPVRRDGLFHFNGSYDLGFVSDLFADRIYQYTGQATPADYRADYSSENDRGTFLLKRP
jgi:hypothetical protein